MDFDLPGSPSSKKLKQIQAYLGIDVGNPSSVALHVDSGSETDDDDGYESSIIDDLGFISENAESQTQLDKQDSSPCVEALASWFGGIAVAVTKTVTAIKSLCVSETEETEIPTSSLTVHAASSSSTNQNDAAMEISRFDVVDAFSDHHYAESGSKDIQPPKNWAKKIQEEWKILMNDLPETIFVRVCETRMELLRAVLVGPSGTPYHDGLFVFDCLFPTDYPNSPPSVYYYSRGLCLNPNLYADGKVCLSLLGTWDGDEEESWMPKKSTMLQVLVSIQAFILNENPFFNEPGYGRYTGTRRGQIRSKKYNEKAFILSLKTMIYTMRRPPEHFKELVVEHFRGRARNILMACKAYTSGALVGSDSTTEREINVSIYFKANIKLLVNVLIDDFSKKGINCDDFRVAPSN